LTDGVLHNIPAGDGDVFQSPLIFVFALEDIKTYIWYNGKIKISWRRENA